MKKIEFTAFLAPPHGQKEPVAVVVTAYALGPWAIHRQVHKSALPGRGPQDKWVVSHAASGLLATPMRFWGERRADAVRWAECLIKAGVAEHLGDVKPGASPRLPDSAHAAYWAAVQAMGERA